MKSIFILLLAIFNTFEAKAQYNLSNINLKILAENNPLKKNLIIGAITNYNWDKIAVFFNSIKKTKFENCDIVMFVANMKQNTIDKIKSCGVIVLPIPEKYLKETIINSRWKIIMDYLDDNPNKYKYIFTGDTRDLLFQDDPFKYYNLTKSYLGIALEDNTLEEQINKEWIINAYGEEVHNKIKNEKIFCVGTVWGTVDKFYEFAKLMWDSLSSEWSKKKHVIEQAVGNYIVYHDKIFDDCLVKSDNDDGYILTIGGASKDKIFMTLDFDILNRKGKKGAVIHQHDRFRELEIKAYMKYYPEYLDNTIYIALGGIIIFIICIIFLVKYYKSINKKNDLNFEYKNIKLVKSRESNEKDNQKLNLE